MDFKTATNIERVDLLEMHNLSLRAKLLDAERDALARALAGKYAATGETITIQDDGSIVRPVSGGPPAAP